MVWRTRQGTQTQLQMNSNVALYTLDVKLTAVCWQDSSNEQSKAQRLPQSGLIL